MTAMPPSSPATGLMMLLPRLAKQVQRRSSQQDGLRLRRLIALSYLRDHQGPPQHELADALAMDANNVVLLLNELECAGLVSRRRDPADRRRHLVEVTADGGRALARAEPALRAIEEEVLQALSRDERQVLLELLRRAVQDAERPAACVTPLAVDLP